MLKKIVPLILAFFLVGCFSEADKAIDLVKSGYLNLDPGITVGDALDKNSLLKDQEWFFFETERGKKIVEFNSVANYFTHDELKKLYKDKKYSNVIDVIKKYNIELGFEIQFTILRDDEFEISYIGYKFKNNPMFINDFHDEDIDKLLSKDFQCKISDLEKVYNQKKAFCWGCMELLWSAVQKILEEKQLAERKKKEKIEIEEMFKAKAKEHEALPVVGFEQMIDDLASSERRPQVGNWIYVGEILTRYGNMERFIDSNVMRGNRYPDYLICDYPIPSGDEKELAIHLSIATPVMSSMEEMLELFGGVHEYNVLYNNYAVAKKMLYGHASLGGDYLVLDDVSKKWSCYDLFVNQEKGVVGFQSINHPEHVFEFDINGIAPVGIEMKKKLGSKY